MKSEGRKVRRALYEISKLNSEGVGGERLKALINGSKCSAESGFTRLNKNKHTQSCGRGARDIVHTNKLDGSLRREVKPL